MQPTPAGLVKFLLAGVVLACFISFPPAAFAQAYPAKPITLYCGFSAGATTDVTALALASGAEKMLGVPVVIENRDGGGSTVCAALIASKKPDGYTLGVITTAALTNRPHALKVAYNPLKDFTKTTTKKDGTPNSINLSADLNLERSYFPSNFIDNQNTPKADTPTKV